MEVLKFKKPDLSRYELSLVVRKVRFRSLFEVLAALVFFSVTTYLLQKIFPNDKSKKKSKKRI